MSVVVVIGAGLSGLVAAQYLKCAGHRIVVIDEHGAGVERDAGWIPHKVVGELELERQGLRVELASPLQATANLAGRDAERWPVFCSRLAKLRKLLEAIYSAPPPDPLTDDFMGYLRLAASALRLRCLGREGIEDFLRLLPMPAADFLDDWFEGDALKGALGSVSVRNLAAGPRSGGTAFNLLHHHVGNPPGIFGAPRSNASEILRRLLAGEIRQGRVTALEVNNGAVTAVVLKSGEKLAADVVVSEADTRRTLTELVDVAWLDPELVRAVRNVRARGVAAQVTLMLDGKAGFDSFDSPWSLDDIERAYDDWKYGEISRAPVVHAVASTREGRHMVDVDVQFVPHDLPAERHEGVRKRIEETVLRMLETRLGARLIGIEVQLPQDLVSRCGFPEGQPAHAELALDQMLWMRPVPGLARYCTPIRGLYLCGPGMHPGIPAATGANAAGIVVADLK